MEPAERGGAGARLPARPAHQRRRADAAGRRRARAAAHRGRAPARPRWLASSTFSTATARRPRRASCSPPRAPAPPQASAAAIVVAGEGWHPGVVGIVASRLVERWRRPCVVISLDGEQGRGSGRSISPYDLHAGLGACAAHLLRFGGHRMAAGRGARGGRVEPFRRALAAHAGAALSPRTCSRRERVDAVVPGGALGLDLAEELERLRPFGLGQPAAHPARARCAGRERGRHGRGAPARALHAGHRGRLALARRCLRLAAGIARGGRRGAARHRAPPRAQPLEGRR